MQGRQHSKVSTCSQSLGPATSQAYIKYNFMSFSRFFHYFSHHLIRGSKLHVRARTERCVPALTISFSKTADVTPAELAALLARAPTNSLTCFRLYFIQAAPQRCLSQPFFSHWWQGLTTSPNSPCHSKGGLPLCLIYTIFAETMVQS